MNPPHLLRRILKQSATPNSRTCYTKWGNTTCASGYSSKFTGYMYAAGQNDGYGGELVCSSGPRYYHYVRTTGGSQQWQAARACAECCRN